MKGEIAEGGSKGREERYREREGEMHAEREERVNAEIDTCRKRERCMQREM